MTPRELAAAAGRLAVAALLRALADEDERRAVGRIVERVRPPRASEAVIVVRRDGPETTE